MTDEASPPPFTPVEPSEPITIGGPPLDFGPTPLPDLPPTEVGEPEPVAYERQEQHRYVIGVVGQHPRILMVVGYESDAAIQVQPGEVIFIADILPPQPFVINADGNGLRSVDLALSVMQDRACTIAKEYRDFRQSAGYLTEFGPVDTDAESRSKLTSACTAAVGAIVTGIQYSVTWGMADDSQQLLTAQQIFEVGIKVAEYYAACQAAYRVIKAAIYAPDIDAVGLAAIDLKGGYPT